MVALAALTVQELDHLAAIGVVDGQVGMGHLWEVEADRCRGIEWIRIILLENEGCSRGSYMRQAVLTVIEDV